MEDPRVTDLARPLTNDERSIALKTFHLNDIHCIRCNISMLTHYSMCYSCQRKPTNVCNACSMHTRVGELYFCQQHLHEGSRAGLFRQCRVCSRIEQITKEPMVCCNAFMINRAAFIVNQPSAPRDLKYYDYDDASHVDIDDWSDVTYSPRSYKRTIDNNVSGVQTRSSLKRDLYGQPRDPLKRVHFATDRHAYADEKWTLGNILTEAPPSPDQIDRKRMNDVFKIVDANIRSRSSMRSRPFQSNTQCNSPGSFC